MFSFGYMDLKGSFFLAWNKANNVNFDNFENVS